MQTESATFNVIGFHSWHLNADTLDAMVAFYHNIAGVEEVRGQTSGGVAVARLRLDPMGIGVLDAPQGTRPGVLYLCLRGTDRCRNHRCNEEILQ
jgi:hypothetical protein